MRAQRWGKIVNVGSMGGRLTFPGGGLYHATKYALEAISDALRFEVRGFGVDVILIEPGLITTDFAQTALASAAAAGEDGNATGGVYEEFNAKLGAMTAGVYEGPMRHLGRRPGRRREGDREGDLAAARAGARAGDALGAADGAAAAAAPGSRVGRGDARAVPAAAVGASRSSRAAGRRRRRARGVLSHRGPAAHARAHAHAAGPSTQTSTRALRAASSDPPSPPARRTPRLLHATSGAGRPT